MKKIIAFGDSIVRGVITDPFRKGRYTISDGNFVSLCGEYLDRETLNFGKFGSTIETGEDIVDRHLSQIRKGDIALLEWGGNDCDFDWNDVATNPTALHNPLTPLAEYRTRYASIIRKIRAAGARPVLLSLPPVDPDRFISHVTRGMSVFQKISVLKWMGNTDYVRGWHEFYNLEIFKTGSALGVPVLDITSAFLKRKDWRNLLCPDGIHPTEEGHALIADVICRAEV